MLTTKLGNLLDSVLSIKILVKERIPVPVGFRLACILNKCNEYYKTYELSRFELQSRYALKLDDGSMKMHEVESRNEAGEKILVPGNKIDFGDNEEAFFKAYEELLNEEIKIDEEPILVERLKDVSTSSEFLLPLIWIFKE